MKEVIKNPKITVIVPCYNHDKFIIECLESIKAQTFQEYQWIVIDDGSSDRSPEILKNNQQKYGYELILQKNKGLSATLTDVIKYKSKGKYISICASDDYWHPEKLITQFNFMEENPNLGMCFGNTYYVDRESKLLSINTPKMKGGYIFEDIITISFHPPVNYMICRHVFEKIGYYPENTMAEDFYMNCMISQKYHIGYLKKYISYYRVEDLAKKRNPKYLYESHRKTIELFKNEKIYKKAVSLNNYRTFTGLAGYKKHKKEASFYMILSLRYVFHKKFIKGVARLMLKWADC